jgi:ATP-binding cassette subfamily B protein
MLRRGRQVWNLIPRTHKAAFGVAILVMACISACNTAMPLLLGRLVDGVKTGEDQHLSAGAMYAYAFWVLLLLAGVYVAREALNVLRRYLIENSCTRLNRDMSVRLVAHLMTGELATLNQERVGALHGRILRSVEGFIRFMRVGFLDFFPAILTGVFAIATTVFKQPLLGLIMVGVIPTAVWLTIRQLVSQKGVRLQLLRSCEEIDGTVVENMTGLEYVRAADTYPLEVHRLKRACERRRAKEIRHHFQMSLYGAAKALNEGLFHVLVLGMAIYLAVQGRVQFGDVLVFSILFLNVMAPLSEIHRVIDEGHEASLRVGDLLEMLRQPTDESFVVPEPREPKLIPGAPVIAIENLSVDYHTPSGKLKRALHGLNLTIRYGETIGVAGPSGAGKSTWIKVLLRLTHAAEGAVYVGGVHLANATRGALARGVGYVGQQPYVFAGSIADNIAYGCQNATREQIVRAAEMANIHDEILLIPGGYDASVTERGANLSGGQRQRLAIARILLRQPPILILDEATSALDNISERQVQKALGLTSADRTTILIAHRLTTLKDADRIVVFDEGRIVEVGQYDELVQRGGLFTELVLSAEQGLGSEEAGPSPGVNGAAPALVAAR